jgi:hypothetical protein
MAGRLLPPFNPALDANGDPIPFARLFTFAAGTSTPKTSYTDETLTTPCSNPVAADAAGRFPPMWAADLSEFRVRLTDQDYAPVVEMDDVRLLGEDPQVLTRDYGPDGRLKITGSGGRVQLEVGDGVGDESGGSVRLGGWAGGQGDEIALDAKAVRATGDLSARGGKLVGPLRLAGGLGTVSSGTGLVLALPEGYARFQLEAAVWSVGPVDGSTPGQLALQGSYNNGFSWQTAYDGALASQGGVALTSPMIHGSAHFVAYVHAKQCVVFGRGAGGDGAAFAEYVIAGRFSDNSMPATHVRILSPGGTASLAWALYGYPEPVTS